ncbi:hypothetical protein [Acinetobacter calcoaceticus]|uniref:hypothetical protein n=1 Tax=Acinetobacter calcoaceticus TaxID=471 RepID=UPI003F771A17
MRIKFLAVDFNMDYCSFNLDILIKVLQLLVPIFITGFVYYIWHKQKSKELLSLEAKNLIMEFFELNKIFHDLQKLNFDNVKDMQLRIREFNSHKVKVLAKLTFLQNCLGNIDFKNNVDLFKGEIWKVSFIYEAYFENEDNYAVTRFEVDKALQPKTIFDNELHPMLTSQEVLLEACKKIAMYRTI